MINVTAPIGTVYFIEKRVIEMVVVVAHEPISDSDARDRAVRTYTLADKGRLIPASSVAAAIEEVNTA